MALMAVTPAFSQDAQNSGAGKMEGDTIASSDLGIKIPAKSPKKFKSLSNSNPLIANVFCADPTAVEYEGRLYVYGTNDEQQFRAVGAAGKNTYERINSLVVLSTEDMVNWTYHGAIDVKAISPWIIASWAPSITSRVEADGKTHFYLYYSNSGWGVGVLTATSPLGPWSDPLGHSIVDGNSAGLGPCSAPFDPGVAIDDNGVGWLTFGGGNPNSSGSDYLPGNARVVKLGADMISFASPMVPIPAPYHFEANELNYINGTYVYTYNTTWTSRTIWKIAGKPYPSACSMAYMTTKTPLDPGSWAYQSAYFRNPGEFQMEYGNNHTHLQKFAGKYYLFYHSLFPQALRGTQGGFRSLCVNSLAVDEAAVSIEQRDGSVRGASQIKPLNPFEINQAETAANCMDIVYAPAEPTGNMTVCGATSGAWTMVKGADFGAGASYFTASVSGKGRIEAYLDSMDGQPIAAVEFDCKAPANVEAKLLAAVSGQHKLFFVLSGAQLQFDAWRFTAL
jgi:hypothetical protein